MESGKIKMRISLFHHKKEITEQKKNSISDGTVLTSTVQQKAGEDMVVFLQNYKHQLRRYKIYRYSLYAALILSCLVFTGVFTYKMDEGIPSTIYIRAGEEQLLRLGIPATGAILPAGKQEKSTIPQNAITINLNHPVVMKTSSLSKYSVDKYDMQVKLFGFLPFKQVGIQVVEQQELIPMGEPVGIYLKTDGVLVIGVGEFQNQKGTKSSPSKYILRSGDYIKKINGEILEEKEDLIERVKQSQGEKMVFTIEREDEDFDVEIQPEKNDAGEYKIGIWVRDNAQGVGTMTYMDADGNFGALGHGINDVDTSMLMAMDGGTLYDTDIVSIKKGENGTPGEMTGVIVYSPAHVLGDISENSVRGIFGKCNEKAKKLADKDPLPIGYKQEIQKGPAKVYCTLAEEAGYYDVEITAIHLDHDNINRGIELKVTDEELLKETGGIVQGMSGSPIIQKGKIIGAITHVFVNDPSKGYGIFIEQMLEK